MEHFAKTNHSGEEEANNYSSYAITLSRSDSPEKIVNFYVEELSKDSWQVKSQSVSDDGGTVLAENNNQGSTGSVGINKKPKEDGKYIITLQITNKITR